MTAPKVSEKTVERWCDDLVAKIGGREAVVRFSQARASMQTEGIPDRSYRVFGCAFWFEVKPSHGKLSRSQYDFLGREYAAGRTVACGGVEELQRMIEACRPSPRCHEYAAEIGWTIVQEWAAKGLRGAKKSQSCITLTITQVET